MALSIAQFAGRLGARVEGRPADVLLEAMASPLAATDRDVSFALSAEALRGASHAAAVITSATAAGDGGAACSLIVPDAMIACARAAAWLPVRRNHAATTAARPAQVASTALISARADIAPGASIGHCSIVEAGAVVGPQARIGAYCRIGPGAVIVGTTQLGNRVEIGAGVIIGEDGFAFVKDGTQWLRMPSFGGVAIGDDVAILARTVVHAGVFGDTVVGSGCMLDSQVLIGHDSRVGAGTAIAGQSALAGASSVGRGCVIGGQVGIGEGVRIADRVTVTGMSMVSRSLDEPGSRYSSGWPAERSRAWWRRVGRLKRLADAASQGTDEQ